jgi:hypothetical protein
MMAEGDGSSFYELFEKYGKDYATWLLGIISSPASIIDKTEEANGKGADVQYLLPILLVSIFVGATIGALIPDRPPFQSRATVFCLVSILWVFMSLLVHGICRMFGGKANVVMTLSLMIQDLAFVYVASNFLTLIIWWSATAYHPLQEFLASRLLFGSPGVVLFSIQFLLLLYLVPFTVSRVHGFKGYVLVMVALFAALFAVCFGVPVFAMGGC